MNTKTCPNCGQINDATQNFCQRCGKPFANQPNNFGGQPNFNQPNFNQPNFGQQQPNFGQPNYNQQNYGGQPNYNPPAQKSSKALWWILGGVLAIVIVGFVGLIGLGILAAASQNSKPDYTPSTPSTSSSAASLDKAIDGKWKQPINGDIFDIGNGNHRYRIDYANGKYETGSWTAIDGSTFKLNSDSGASITWSVTITGDTMTIYNSSRGRGIYTRID